VTLHGLPSIAEGCGSEGFFPKRGNVVGAPEDKKVAVDVLAILRGEAVISCWEAEKVNGLDKGLHIIMLLELKVVDSVSLLR